MGIRTYAKWHFQTKGWLRDKITEMGATCGRVQVYRAWGPSFNLQREKKNKMLYPKKVGVAPRETWESLFLRGLRQKMFKGRGLLMSFLSTIKEDRRWISRTWFLFLCSSGVLLGYLWWNAGWWRCTSLPGERAELIERDQCSWALSPGERAQGSGEVGLLWRGTKVCGCGLLGGRRAISVQDTWLGMEKRMVLNNMCNITHSLGKCIRISTYICIEFSRRIWENYEHLWGSDLWVL